MTASFEEIGRLLAEAAADILRAEAALPAQPQPSTPPAPVLAPPAVATMPDKVFVALAISQKVVAVRQASIAPVVTQPLHGGRESIFGSRSANLEAVDVTEAEVVAVCSTAEAAEHAVMMHRRANVEGSYSYSVTPMVLDGGAPESEPVVDKRVAQACIDCGQPASTTRCDPCQQRFWEDCRSADAELLS